MKARRVGMLALSALIGLTLAVIAAQPASAHTPTASARVYDTYGLCTISWSQIAHDHATGQTTASAHTYARVANCTTIDMFAPGHLAVRLDLQKWTRAGWVNCQSTDWVYNSTWNDEIRTSRLYGANRPDCDGTANDGPGYFRTQGVSYVWDGSAWRGGATQSGYHYLP
ncbi:MAG: hypothetical protein ACRDV1_10245 [Actinomycetes bacterium]